MVITKRQNSKHQEMDARIRELRAECKLDTWTSFVEELKVPSVIYPALMTNRPELLKAAPVKALTEGECRVMYDLVGGLMETNAALRKHASDTAHLVNNWTNAVRAMVSIAGQIEQFANFRQMNDEEDAGETQGR